MPEEPNLPTKPVSRKGQAGTHANCKAPTAGDTARPTSEDGKEAKGVQEPEETRPKLLAAQVAISPAEQSKMAKGKGGEDEEDEEKPRRGRPKAKAKAKMAAKAVPKSKAKAQAKTKSKGRPRKDQEDEVDEEDEEGEDESDGTQYYTPKKKPSKKPSKKDAKPKKKVKKTAETKEEKRKALLSRKSCAYKRVRLIMEKKGCSTEEILAAARRATCP